MNIQRPIVTENYTALPNELFDFGRSIHHSNVKLKPRDSSVLNYLLSKPPHWKIIAADIAKAVNISLNTVYRALTVLQKLGVVSYTRDKFGYTRWLVSVSQTLYRPATAPHNQKPRVENEYDLKNNEISINNKTTSNFKKEIKKITTQTIIEQTPFESVIEFDLPENLTETEKLTAIQSLKKANLDVTAYSIILFSLKTALNNGVVRSPLAYLNGLINKAKNGNLGINQLSENEAQKTEIRRSEEITQLFEKYGEKIFLDIVTNSMIKTDLLGYITYDEVKKIGLINEKWATKYNELQLAKMQRLSSVKTVNKDTKQAKKMKLMNEAEFEAKRQAQIQKAMAML